MKQLTKNLFIREKQLQKKLELQEQLRLDNEEIRRRKKEEEEAHRLHQDKILELEKSRRHRYILQYT